MAQLITDAVGCYGLHQCHNMLGEVMTREQAIE